MKQKQSTETIPVRAGEELNRGKLEAYLRAKLEGLPSENLEI